MSSRDPKVELYLGENGRWYFHKLNGNGKITEPSQGYKHKQSAVRAAKRDIPGVQIVLWRNRRKR